MESNESKDLIESNKVNATKKDKKKEQEDLVQIDEEFIETVYQQVLKENKNPSSIFKNHMYNVPKYKDEVLIALMIKLKLLKGYKCHSAGCTVKKAWKRKPIQLLFNRKNNKKYDLRPDNLELICPNCYLQYYGVQKLIIKLDSLVMKCTLCQFPLNNNKNKGNYNKYCYVCSKKIAQQSQTEFENNHSRKIMEISCGHKSNNINQNSFKKNEKYNSTTDFKVNYDTSKNMFVNSISESNNKKTKTINMNMNLDLDLNQFVENLTTNDNSNSGDSDNNDEC